MRMVYTASPDDIFYPARDRLVALFDRWARRQRRPVDLMVIEALIEDRWFSGDGILSRWQPADLRQSLCVFFPRKISLPVDECADALATVHAFIDFLFDQDLADARCADADRLHQAVDDLAVEFLRAMADEGRYGPAKFWTMRMLAAGIDLTDSEATQRYIADLNAGRITVDQDLLDRVMAGHLAAADNAQPPPLPVVALADRSTLTAAATESVVLERIRDFVEWVGPGRTLTATGRLRLADAREVIALLGLADVVDPQIGGRTFKTMSSEELYETSLVFAWAKAARVVRTVKGRLVPVKSATKLLDDPLALAQRVFDAFFTLREPICGPQWDDSMIAWRFDEVVFGVVMGPYLAQEPLELAHLEDVAWQIVGQTTMVDLDSPYGQVWRGRGSHDVRRLLEQLAVFGAITLRGKRAALTPLGVALVAEHLTGLGVAVPTADSLLDETVEVVVTHAVTMPAAARDDLMARWSERNHATAATDLHALARRTDDRRHRRFAETAAKSLSGSPRSPRAGRQQAATPPSQVTR